MRTLRTVACGLIALSLVASSAWAAELVIPGVGKAGGLQVPAGASATVTVCTTPRAAGVTITAQSSNPTCVTVTPASAVTGPNGCADFTVRCVDGTCNATITWSAAGYWNATATVACVVVPPDSTGTPGTNPPTVGRVPTLSEWGLMLLALSMIAVAAVMLRRRRRVD